MRWECGRGCGAGGEKVYAEPSEAKRYAEAFNSEKQTRIGQRAPLVALLPLRMWARLKRSSADRE